MAKKQRPLVTDERYRGKYVAFASSGCNEVIASGSNPGTVIKNARNKGVEVPAIVFVPKENVAYIY